MWYDTHGDSVACGPSLRLKQLLYPGDVLNMSVSLHLLIMIPVPVMTIAIVSGKGFVKLGRNSRDNSARPPGNFTSSRIDIPNVDRKRMSKNAGQSSG